MSINEFPDEILEEIFNHLDGKEVSRCRRVNRRWREIIDCLPDSFWQRKCSNDEMNEDYAVAHKKYGLSWRGVYKALNGWDHISDLPVNMHQPCSNVRDVKVLPNGIIALVKNLKHKKSDKKRNDTIIYYNLETNEECDRIEYDFVFNVYDENDHFVVLILNLDNLGFKKMFIMSKTDKKLHSIDDQDLSVRFGYPIQFKLVDNEVCIYQWNIVVVVRMTEVEGQSFIDTEPLPVDVPYELGGLIRGISKNAGKLYVVNEKGCIINFNNDSLQVIYNPDFETPCKLTAIVLKKYGFNWKDINVWIGIRNSYDHNAYYVLGNVLLLLYAADTDENAKIKIVLTYSHNSLDSEDTVHHQTKRILDMPEKLYDFTSIEKIDIVETTTHHKIIVLVREKIYVFDFKYCTEQTNITK